MHRVSVAEHRQVGHVDDVGDGAHAEGRQPVANVRRRGPDLHAGDRRRAVVRAALGVLDLHAERVAEDSGRARRRLREHVRQRRQGEGQVEQGRRLAREPHVPESVRPVRREVDVEHVIVRRRDRVGELGPRIGAAGRKHEDAFARIGQPELRLAAQHAFAGNTSDVATRHRHPFAARRRWQVGTERRQHHQTARLGHVGRAAHHFLRVALAEIDGDERQLVLRRVRLLAQHRHDQTRRRRRAELLQPLDLEPGEGERIGQLARRGGERRQQLADERVGGFHFSCLRTAAGSGDRCR